MHSSVGQGGNGAGMQCYACHNPHGRGDGNLKQTAAGEPACLGCHTEKRGPFVFTHGALVAGDCRSCHEPHGSVNPKMLTRSTVAQLCLECHSNITGTTLGSQPPSLHDLRSPRYQSCTTCHTAVHGSNVSPRLLR
jgi:DmsE family decaheme c-type cytochrome